MKNPFSVKKIAAGTWVIEAKTFYYQGLMYVLAGKDRAAVIDAGMNIGDFKAAADGVTELPKQLYITHGHADHIGAAHRFGQAYVSPRDLPVIKAHTNPAYIRNMLVGETPAVMRLLFGGGVKRITAEPPPVKWSVMPKIIDLGDRVIEVIETPGHTPGGVCFLDRDKKLLFSGDTLCDWGVLLHLDFCETIQTYRESLARLKDLAPAYNAVYGGHHGYPVKNDALDRYIECADGIISGKIKPQPDKYKLNAFCGDIRITLPKK